MGLWQPLRAVALVVATAVITLVQVNLPNGYWASKVSQIYLAVAVVAAFALMDAGKQLTIAGLARSVRRYHDDMHTVLAAGLLRCAEVLGCEVTEVSVHAFFVHRASMRRRLVSAGKIRLSPRPSMLNTRWTLGKGVIGQAWKDTEVVTEDWEERVREWSHISREQWRRLPSDDRFRLSWTELHATRSYGRIAAAPIVLGNGVVVGCVALTTSAPLASLSTTAHDNALHDLALAMSRLGPPPFGWLGGTIVWRS